VARPDDAEWTDEDFIPRAEPHVLDQLREEIRQKLADGIPREQVEDELIRDGRDPEYAVALVDSVRRSMPPELVPAAPREVSDEWNVADGTVQCERCRRTVPEDEARPLLRLQYKGNYDYEGQSEYGRRRMMVCSACHRRMMRWQWLDDLRGKLGLTVMLALAVGLVALFLYGLLRAFGVWG
jgi:hypothetical protein